MTADARPTLLVLASTYPRWSADHEPGFVHELAKRLTDRFRVIVSCPHADGALTSEILDGVEVHRYRYAPGRWESLVNDGGIVVNLRENRWKLLLIPGFVFAQMWQAWKLLRKEGVDVIHAHWLIPQGLTAALLQGLPGRRIPFVVTSHGADLHALNGGFMNRLKRFVTRHATVITVVSGAMREKLLALGVDPMKTSVMPMGVDVCGQFTIDSSVQRSGRELLFVGRLVEKKGLRHLLDAMPMVLQRLPDAFLTIAGFGPEEDVLKKQVDELGLKSNVHFLGAVRQAELPSMYRRAALFVAPFVRAKSGDEEGLGLVLVEAIGCGCPILVGDVPATTEVLGNEFGETRINVLDVKSLAKEIINMLNDPEGAHERAVLLRKKIGSRFDWNEVSRRYANLLMQMVTAKRHASE